MGVHHPYHLDLCADDEDPSQLIIRLGWDAPHVRCFPRTLCAWPCLLRQVGTVLGSPYDYVVAGLAYAKPGVPKPPTVSSMIENLYNQLRDLHARDMAETTKILKFKKKAEEESDEDF